MAKAKSFSLETRLADLRTILEKLQDPKLTFDENLDYFRKGSALIQECRDYLDESELLVKKLTMSQNGPEESDFD